MSKIRINELARQLEVKSREVIDKLHELGIAEKVTHSSSIDDDMADKLRRYYAGDGSVRVGPPRDYSDLDAEDDDVAVGVSDVERLAVPARAVTGVRPVDHLESAVRDDGIPVRRGDHEADVVDVLIPGVVCVGGDQIDDGVTTDPH